MKSYVTTRQGDAGATRTLASDKVSKTDPVIECTGCLDTLRVQTALLRLEILELSPETDVEVVHFLLWLLHTFFLLGATVSDPRNKKPELHRGTIEQKHLERLERIQARLEAQLDLPQAFIVSATNRVAARADITTTTTRTLERRLVALAETVPEFNGQTALAFVNRLSDFFFILARYLEQGSHLPVDYAVLDEDAGDTSANGR